MSLVDQELLPCRSTCVYFGLCLSFDLWFILYLHTFLIATQLIKWKMWFQIIIFLSEVKCFIIRCELRVLFQVTCILHLHISYVFGLFHSAGCLSFSCWYTFFYLILSMYSIVIHEFNHSIQPIIYKALDYTYMWYKMDLRQFFFHDVISRECRKSSLIITKGYWWIVQISIVYVHVILQRTVASKIALQYKIPPNKV